MEEFERMVKAYELRRIKLVGPVMNHGLKVYAEYENGDRWDLRPVTDSSRGYKCNVSYIQRGIPLDKIRRFIQPSMIGPYSAYKCY